MSAADAGYAPLSYHCGSVWPHDTAIVIGGLHRAGLGEYAAGLIEGLLRASVAFDQRRARAVERRRPSGAVSGGLPPAGLVGRVGGRGGTSRSGRCERPAGDALIWSQRSTAGDCGWCDPIAGWSCRRSAGTTVGQIPREILEVAQDRRQE